MRTTIELPASLRQKLVSEAAARGRKGFSGIIAEALELYFKRFPSSRRKEIQSLRGCIDPGEHDAEMRRLKEIRSNWRI